MPSDILCNYYNDRLKIDKTVLLGAFLQCEVYQQCIHTPFFRNIFRWRIGSGNNKTVYSVANADKRTNCKINLTRL